MAGAIGYCLPRNLLEVTKKREVLSIWLEAKRRVLIAIRAGCGVYLVNELNQILQFLKKMFEAADIMQFSLSELHNYIFCTCLKWNYYTTINECVINFNAS